MAGILSTSSFSSDLGVGLDVVDGERDARAHGSDVFEHGLDVVAVGAFAAGDGDLALLEEREEVDADAAFELR